MTAEHATLHPLVAALKPDGTKAEQLGQAVNHTMFVPVYGDVLRFDDPVRYGNRVYGQVLLMLSLALNVRFQQSIAQIAAAHTASTFTLRHSFSAAARRLPLCSGALHAAG